MRGFCVLLLLIASAASIGAAADSNSVPVSRVIENCGGKSKEINVSALQEAAEILKESNPDLSSELQKMALESTV